MLQLFADARAGLPLSPAARALLKLLEGLLLAAVVAALPVIAQLLAGADLAHMDWPAFGREALAVLAMAFLLAASKYAKAHGDSPLAPQVAQAAESAAAKVQQWGGVPNDVKIEVVPPDDGEPPLLSGEPVPPPVPPITSASFVYPGAQINATQVWPAGWEIQTWDNAGTQTIIPPKTL